MFSEMDEKIVKAKEAPEQLDYVAENISARVPQLYDWRDLLSGNNYSA